MSISKCDRLVVLLNAAGKKLRYPLPAGMELKEEYTIDGEPYRVVMVLYPTELDDLKARIERAEALA